jgi:hypothetical protein
VTEIFHCRDHVYVSKKILRHRLHSSHVGIREIIGIDSSTNSYGQRGEGGEAKTTNSNGTEYPP